MRLAANPRFESAAVLALAAAVFAPGLAAEQLFPAKPITVIVPLAVGSPPETMARALDPFLAPTLGQPIVIVPRGGAGGTIGGQVVANAKPDGYTLLMGSGSSLAIGPALYPQAGFNAALSFAPVGQVYSSPFVLMTGAKFPATTLTEFIAAAKAKPGGLVAPRGTPPAIINQLNDAIQAVLAEKEFRDVLTRFGAEPEGGSPAQFGRLIEVDGARWAAVVKATGAKGE